MSHGASQHNVLNRGWQELLYIVKTHKPRTSYPCHCLGGCIHQFDIWAPRVLDLILSRNTKWNRGHFIHVETKTTISAHILRRLRATSLPQQDFFGPTQTHKEPADSALLTRNN